MKTFCIIFLALCIVYAVWDFLFGDAYRDKTRELMALKYVEDNMFRVEHIMTVIDMCDNEHELKAVEEWVNDKAQIAASQISAEAQVHAKVSNAYGVKISLGIIQMIKERYDEKLNSF